MVSCNLDSSDFDQTKRILKARFRLYVHRYIAFARMRGFKSFNDWPYHRRGFIECWAEPGFHKFWQVWNPGIAYFVFRLYLKLGGKKNPLMATILSFEINALVHSVVFYLISGQWSFVIFILFFLFSIILIINRKMERLLSQNTWPWIFNAAINIGLVILCFEISFRLNTILFQYFNL